MSTNTINYNLVKPAYTDSADIQVLNNNFDKIDAALLKLYETASGTATAIILSDIKLVNGCPKTFIASANNNGNATTINGKHLYKPSTTTSPVLIKDKAYTVWYNSTGDCFFIKASATGNTIPSHVLAGDGFSTDYDIDQIGTMPNNGSLNYTMPINGTYTVPLGYTSGGTITQSITTKTAQTYNPSTTPQTISAGQYLSGIQTIAPVIGNASVDKVVSGYVFSSANGINLTGTATIESLGGYRYITGTAVATKSTTNTYIGEITINLPSNALFFVCWGDMMWETNYPFSGSTYAIFNRAQGGYWIQHQYSGRLEGYDNNPAYLSAGTHAIPIANGQSRDWDFYSGTLNWAAIC